MKSNNKKRYDINWTGCTSMLQDCKIARLALSALCHIVNRIIQNSSLFIVAFVAMHLL